MSRLSKIIAWCGVSLMMAGIFGVIAVALIFHHYSKDLPSFEKLAQYDPAVLTRLYAGDGRLLAEYATEKRIFVPLKAIPARVKNAFIAAEDKNFYDHPGVDITGIIRAMRENVANMGTGRGLAGGSTITQQVVKNFLLTSEKSLERKIKEAILAYRISSVYSKDKILELYLNEIYLGRGSYGVAIAALNYFNKSLDELTISEAALLAGLPKAPAHYNPKRNYKAALERRNYVIRRMQSDGHIDDNEASLALASAINLESRSKEETVSAEFFAEDVRRKLAALYGANILYEGGLTVKTTVDPDLQTYSDQALRSALIAYDRRYGYRGALAQMPSVDGWEVTLTTVTEGMKVPLYDGQKLAVVLTTEKDKATIGLPDGSRGVMPLSEMKWARKDMPLRRVGPAIGKTSDALKIGDIIIAQPLDDIENGYALHQVPVVSGALVAMDPHTGRVLAMSGGYSYGDSEFNRATQARRQPGSAFKPFVYLAALENGLTPSTIVMDQPVEISQGPGKPLWRPQNYGGKFLGATTLRRGLEKSRNAMTVRLAQMIGLGRVIRVAKRFGIYDGRVPKNYSMVLGSKETTLIKLVNAYGMLVNGGYEIEPSIIERIDDRDGEVIYRRDDRPCKGCKVDSNSPAANMTPPVLDDTREVVVDPRVAFQVVSLLEGAVKRGTGVRAKVVGKPLGGKTGTTNDSRDAWFVGFAPDLVAGVYIGYDTPKSLGKKETGSGVALPGFISFMKKALSDKAAVPFRAPKGIRMVQVDRGTGLPPYPGEASGKLIQEAFVVGGSIYKPPLPDGEVDDEPPVVVHYDVNDELDDGFDPHAGWQDVNPRHYISPDEAQRRDQQFQQQYRRPFNRREGYVPQPYANGQRQQPQQQPAPPQGYDMNQGRQQRPVPQPDYNTGTSATMGTGGLY